MPEKHISQLENECSALCSNVKPNEPSPAGDFMPVYRQPAALLTKLL